MYLHGSEKLAEQTDIYTHSVKLLGGETLDLTQLHGRPTLFVNTASKCGFTHQYEGLQKLYEEFGPRGLQLIGTPSGDFADQEFDDADQIGAFCQRNYGVSFPLTERASVRQDPDPLWQDLGSQPNSAPPVWNFTKYLVGADGRLIVRWPSKVAPDDPRVREAVEAALPEPRSGGGGPASPNTVNLVSGGRFIVPVCHGPVSASLRRILGLQTMSRSVF
jgi:glutathione peroxidase